MENLTVAEFFKDLAKEISYDPEWESGTYKTKRVKTIIGTVHELSSIDNSINSCILEIRVISLEFKDKPAIALIFSDVTESNLVVSLQDNNDYKNRLLASVSHELRTPLNASLNFIQTAIEDPNVPDNVRQDLLMPSLMSNHLLLFLINDILDFSQISAKKLRLVYEKASIKKTIQECLDLVRMQIARKGLQLFVSYDMIETESMNEVCILDPQIITDHGRLKQIVLNLLSNALKFTLQGEIKVIVKVTTTIEHGRILSIEVSDTGIGISDENIKKLFGAFEKMDLEESAGINSRGVGLGLMIANNLALMLGPVGQSGIKIASRLGCGSSFSFLIAERQDLERCHSEMSGDFCVSMNELEGQYRISESEKPIFSFYSSTVQEKGLFSGVNPFYSSQSQPRDAEQLIIYTKKPRCCPSVLVVDDDIFNITAMETILKKLGYRCNVAYNGKQAIEKVKDRHKLTCEHQCGQYKIIFMDFSMPIMDGYEATRTLKAAMSRGELERIPIVGCTAFVQEKEKLKGLDSGMDSYCTKPLNREKVRTILDQFEVIIG